MTVTILDKDQSVGDWLLTQLNQRHIGAQWLPTATDLLVESEKNAPIVCLVALRPPVAQALSLITNLRQEPCFAKTAFILMGPTHYKRAGFEAGADDYLTTPPDVIELRKRVRLYLDRAELKARVVAETRITQEMDAISNVLTASQPSPDQDTMTLLEHVDTLTQERNRYDMVLAHVAEAIAFVAADGTLLYANPTWETLIGNTLDIRVGQALVWPPITDHPIANQDIADAIEHQLPWEGDVTFTLPDGERLNLAMSIHPALTANNELAGFVVTQQDITQRRATESLKTQFWSDAAVEMRTPVTNIKMRQYLLAQAPEDQRPTHLQALKRAAERLSNLVESMLELSRLDSGMVELQCEATDLNRLLSEAAIRYGPSAKNKGVTLGTTRDDSVSPVEADQAHIARALGILIENAIQHTPEGGQLEVCLVPEARNGGEFLTIQVVDTGMGITPDTQPHIFERFYRGERTRELGIQGAGLGLSIAQEIVALHNGHITVESAVNEGCTFTIWLPVKACGSKTHQHPLNHDEGMLG